MNQILRVALVLSALALLAGCGTRPGERVGGGAAAGAGTGAVVGAIAGPPGAAVGAAVGAAAGGVTGAVTSPSQVNLGRPPVPNTMTVGNTTVHP
jgi:YMGG-like Gly-zipper